MGGGRGGAGDRERETERRKGKRKSGCITGKVTQAVSIYIFNQLKVQKLFFFGLICQGQKEPCINSKIEMFILNLPNT